VLNFIQGFYWFLETLNQKRRHPANVIAHVNPPVIIIVGGFSDVRRGAEVPLSQKIQICKMIDARN